MKKSTKILVLLLTLALICAGLVIATSADTSEAETVSYVVAGETAKGTLADAIAKADAGTTVKLLGNCTVADAIAVAKTVTIDLNGYALTTSGANAFNVSGAETVFTVTGTGSITAAGVLATATEDGATINVVGTGVDGIDIVHTGSSGKYELTVMQSNTLTFTNVNINSTATPAKGISKSLFTTTGDSVETFNNCYVTISTTTDTGYGAGAHVFANIVGKTCITINNSAFYSHNNGFVMSDAKNSGNKSLVIKNSVVSCNSNGYENITTRTALVFANNANAAGIVHIEDSTLECSGRMFASENTSTADVVINGYGTTFRVIRAEGDQGSTNASHLTRYFDINFYNSESGKSCRLINNEAYVIQLNKKGLWYANAYEPGMRVNLSAITTALESKATDTHSSSIRVPAAVDENGNVTSWTYAASSTDDAYAWVYDPVGDPEAPYVLVDTTKQSVDAPDWSASWSFDSMLFAAKGDKTIRKEYATKVKSDAQNFLDTMHVGSFRGSILSGYETGNSYIKYEVTPYDESMGVTVKEIYGENYDGSYRIYNTEKTFDESKRKELAGKDSASKPDPFFDIGYTDFDNGNYVNTGYSTRKVVVVDFDFGSDSQKGFPALTLITQSRSETSGNLNDNNKGDAARRLNIANSGAITNSLDNQPEGAYTKLNTNEWYHFSIVHYTEANIAYIYINGQLMGSSPANFDGIDEKSYIQGYRINVNNGSKHVVGSSFALDNACIAAYSDYKYNENAETLSSKTAYNYAKTASPRKYMHDAITVNGRPMANMAEAVAVAKTTNSKVVVNANIDLGNVTENVVVDFGNYTAKFGADSYGFVQSGTNYTFDENYWYNAYKFTGDINKLATGTDDKNNFTLVGKVKLGHEFNIDNYYTDRVENYVNLTVDTQNGWVYDLKATESVLPKVPDLSDFERADKNNNVYYLPLLEAVPMSHVVKDAEGNILSYGLTNDDTNNAFLNLVSGTTLVLLQDLTVSQASSSYIVIVNQEPVETKEGVTTVNGVVVDNDYTEEEIATMRQVASDFKIDLNGNTLDISKYRIVIGQNIEYSVYSSKPGANVNMVTYNGTKIVGSRAFNMMYTNGTTSWFESADNMLKNMNSRYNFGTYVDRNGNEVKSEMFTMTGAVVFEAVSADSSCSFNINNVSAARVTNDSNGLIVSRYFDGKINVNNSILTTIATGTNAYTMVHIMRPDYGHKETPDPVELVFNPEIVFEDCMFLNTNPTQNAVNNGGNTTDKSKNIIFRNCISNTRLNSADRAHVYFGEGTASQNMLVGGQFDTEGLIEAYCWEPMTTEGFAADGDYFVQVLKPVYDAATGKISYTAYYFVNNGYGEKFAAEHPGAAYYELPLLTTKVVKEEDAVRVSFSRLDGSEAIYAYYVKGVDVQTKFVGSDRKSVNNWDLKAEYRVYNANAVTLTYAGWEALPTNVQEDVVIKPTYTVAPNVSGLKANLSLYADFNVNLYIPATYADYLKVYVLENALDTTAYTSGDAEYLMATVSQKCNMATDNVVFTLKIAETVDGKLCEATVNASVSIAGYAATVLAGDSFTDADKVLMYYMLNYANEAEAYIDGAANDTVTALLNDNAKYGAMYNADYTYGKAVDTAALSTAFDNATLDIESTPAFLLTLKAGFEGTVTVSYANGLNVRTYTVTADDARDLVIEGMKIYNFGTMITITAEGTVNGEAVSVEGKYTLDTFANYHDANSKNEESETKADSEACMTLVKSLVAYAEVAELYKTGALAGALVTE